MYNNKIYDVLLSLLDSQTLYVKIILLYYFYYF
jgi:hypothetical protein